MIIKNINQLTPGDLIKIDDVLCRSLGVKRGIVKDVKNGTIYYWGYNHLLEEIELKECYVGDSIKEGTLIIEIC